MKNKFVALFLTLLLVPAMAFAAAKTKEADKPDVKDAALAFILEKAKDYSGKAEVAVGKAVDFVVAETPEVIKEFLRWRAWMHGGYFFLSIVWLAGCATVLIKTVKSADKRYMSETSLLLTILSGIGTTIGFIIFLISFDHLFSFIQILVAPRIYLIEQAAALLK